MDKSDKIFVLVVKIAKYFVAIGSFIYFYSQTKDALGFVDAKNLESIVETTIGIYFICYFLDMANMLGLDGFDVGGFAAFCGLVFTSIEYFVYKIFGYQTLFYWNVMLAIVAFVIDVFYITVLYQNIRKS